jgi:hypothetical protein
MPPPSALFRLFFLVAEKPCRMMRQTLHAPDSQTLCEPPAPREQETVVPWN